MTTTPFSKWSVHGASSSSSPTSLSTKKPPRMRQQQQSHKNSVMGTNTNETWSTPVKSSNDRLLEFTKKSERTVTQSPSAWNSPKRQEQQPLIPKPPLKTIYLIRHGESLAQRKPRQERQNDTSLTDCGLSANGIWQAQEMIPKRLGQVAYESIELVLTSPLTRALQTSLLAFPHKPILCHYHLREIGSMIPENIPRPMKQVLLDMEQRHGLSTDRVDVATLQPEHWPKRHDTPPKVIRRDHVRAIFQWIAKERTEQTIAVVCHYHVIMAALADPVTLLSTTTTTAKKRNKNNTASVSISPENATPIKCYLDPETGRLSLATEYNPVITDLFDS